MWVAITLTVPYFERSVAGVPVADTEVKASMPNVTRIRAKPIMTLLIDDFIYDFTS